MWAKDALYVGKNINYSSQDEYIRSLDESGEKDIPNLVIKYAGYSIWKNGSWFNQASGVNLLRNRVLLFRWTEKRISKILELNRGMFERMWKIPAKGKNLRLQENSTSKSSQWMSRVG